MKSENLAVNLSLLEKPHAVRMLCLVLSGHWKRFLDCGDAPMLVDNPITRDYLSLSLRVAQDPTINERATILISFRM